MSAKLVVVALVVLQSAILLALLYLWLPAGAAVLRRLSRRKGTLTHIPQRYRSFAVLVPARNEELVIGPVLEALASQRFPHNRYKVYVVADNCDDCTAEAAASHPGVECFVRDTGSSSSKAAALRWLWNEISRQRGASLETQDPDAVVVIDADTVPAQNFLSVINCEFESGSGPRPRAIQVRRLAKDADANWVAALDACSDSLRQNLAQAGRAALGLGGFLSGSGMAFDAPLFSALVNGEPLGRGENHGSPASGPPGADEGLTEDRFWQARLASAGIEVLWTDKTLVRDCKTRSLRDWRSQRRRWASGRSSISRTFVSLLGKRLLASRGVRAAVEAFDQLLYLLQPCLPVLATAVAAMTAFAAAAHSCQELSPFSIWCPLWVWIGAAAGIVLYVIVGLALEGASLKRYVCLVLAPLVMAQTLAVVVTLRWRRRMGRAMTWDAVGRHRE